MIEHAHREQLNTVIAALLSGTRNVHVKTASREFSGTVMELRRSPFSNNLAASVVEEDGRVNHFFIKGDSEVTIGHTEPAT